MNATRPALLATAVVALMLAGTRLNAHCDTLAGAGAHHAEAEAAPATPAPAHAHEH